MKKEQILLLLLLLIPFSLAHADTIYLKNGNELEGIIIKETEEIVELEVDIDARISLLYSEIESIKRYGRGGNKGLENQWINRREVRNKRDEKKQKYETEQRAKGLVEYRGKWIKKEEKERLESETLVDEILNERIERRNLPSIDVNKISYAARVAFSEEEWNSRETEHFVIYYTDLNQAKAVSDRAEYLYEKITYDIGYGNITWDSKCKVFIVPTQDKWDDFLKKVNANLELVGGFVSHGQREVFLCALSLPYLSVAFPHELTHLIFRELAGERQIPLWLNEGIAIYESGFTSYANQLLEQKLKSEEFIPLWELLRLQNYPKGKEKIELFYAESGKIVEFIITQHGRSSFSDFCKLVLDGTPFEDAVGRSCKSEYRNIEDFSKAWIRYIVK